MTSPTELTAALVGAASRAQQRLADALRDAGISPSGFAVLRLLDAQAPREPVDLAAVLGVSRPTMTGLLDTLERRGLARRAPHPSDGRRVHVTLTDAGRDLLGRHRPAYDEACAGITAPLTSSDRAALHALLARLERGPAGYRAGPAPPDGG